MFQRVEIQIGKYISHSNSTGQMAGFGFYQHFYHGAADGVRFFFKKTDCFGQFFLIVHVYHNPGTSALRLSG